MEKKAKIKYFEIIKDNPLQQQHDSTKEKRVQKNLKES